MLKRRAGAWMSLSAMVAFCVLCVRPLRAGWRPEGTPVCAVDSEQYAPCIVGDGAGGAIIVWLDGRNENPDIYAQRITGEGEFAWPADGVEVCTSVGRKSEVKVVPGADGGAIILWVDRRVEWDVFAQRVRGGGAVAWGLDGVPVSMADDEQKYISLAADGAGGAIACWYDSRFGWDEHCIYAQRIDSTGSGAWDPDGVRIVRSAEPSKMPQVVPAGDGGALVVWGKAEDGDMGLRAQRINEFGDCAWDGEGVPLSRPRARLSIPWIVSDGAGSVICSWWDRRGGDRNIYAQRIDGSGKVVWGKNDAVVCDEKGHQMFPRILPTPGGGAIIVWEDMRDMSWDIYAQRLDESGRRRWAGGGVPVCTAPGSQRHPRIVSDGEGGAVIVWRDKRGGADEADIYGQRIDGEGNPAWAENGIPVVAAPGEQYDPEAVSDGAGGAIVVWNDGRSPIRRLYAARLGKKRDRGHSGP